MDLVMGLVIGIGLSAACGFRVFVPLLGMCLASMAGHLTLSPGFEWIGSWPALVAFASATVLEVAAFYIPGVDHVLDHVAAPAAMAAGIIATASQVGHLSPMLKWSLAIIAGGGASAVVHAGMMAARAGSAATTLGLGNFLVATFELVASVVVTALVIVVPVVALVVVVVGCSAMIRRAAKSPAGPVDGTPGTDTGLEP